MIIVDDVIQGDPSWLQSRLGCLTASQVDKLLTPTLKLSGQRVGLLHTLLAEWALGERVDDFGGSYWTERGQELEAQAVAYFEFQTGLTVGHVGLIYRDESRTTGCSPDGLVYEDGAPVAGIEMKCPKAATHVGYLLTSDGAAGYDYQVQYSLWVTGLPRWYFQSYYPGLPPVLRCIEPDAKWQTAFDTHVPVFLDELSAAKVRLAELGCKQVEAFPEE